jgi:Domain of unknown function (DUF4384)/Caspase domain
MRRVLLALIAALVIGPAVAADVVVTRATDLRADRYSDAASLGQLAAGTRVALVATEAGWVKVAADRQTGWIRATGLTGDAANVSALARLDTGRSAVGNIVVAAGIRGIPKASKHALIIGVDEIVVEGRAPTTWGGTSDDVEAAQLIAARIGVPGDNVEVVRGRKATMDEIGQAFDRLNDRVQPGDQVLLYFSGPGTWVNEAGACATAWVTQDARAWSAAALVKRLRPTFATADKVMTISDAAYGARDGPMSPAIAPLRAVLPASQSCARPAPRLDDLPLIEAAAAAGLPAQNLVHLQSAGNLQGLQQAPGGGLFTQALADCILGDVIDLDGSGSISVAELATCVDRHASANGTSIPGRRAAVSGNAAYSAIVGVRSSQPQAVIAGVPMWKAAIVDVFGQRDARFDVTLIATPSTLTIGRDALDLTLTSARAGFVYLVLLGSDGNSFYVLFPNDLDRDNRIAAGETLRLPRPNWRVQSQGPAGQDTLLAIVAESERDLTPFAAHKEGPFSVALTDADGRAQLQWLLGRSGRADTGACVEGGKRRNLAAVKVCSDAFGAAMVEVIEKAP